MNATRKFMTALFLYGSTLSLTATETPARMGQLTAAAMNGDPDSQFELALLYDDDDVKKDEKAAIYWYTKAAEQGNACAAYNLGSYYADKGHYDKAIEWYKSAEKNGDTDAMIGIAACYFCKYVFSAYCPYFFLTDRADRMNSLNSAVEWTIKAENKGVREAKALLGLFYLMDTKYTKRDLNKAKTLLRIAEKMGEEKKEEENIASQSLHLISYLEPDNDKQKYVEYEIICLINNNNPAALISKIDNKEDILNYINDQLASNEPNSVENRSKTIQNSYIHFPADFEKINADIDAPHKSYLQFLTGLWYYYHPHLEERLKCIDWWGAAQPCHKEIIVHCISRLATYYQEKEKYHAARKLLLLALESDQFDEDSNNDFSDALRKVNESETGSKKRSWLGMRILQNPDIAPTVVAFLSQI